MNEASFTFIGPVRQPSIGDYELECRVALDAAVDAYAEYDDTEYRRLVAYAARCEAVARRRQWHPRVLYGMRYWSRAAA